MAIEWVDAWLRLWAEEVRGGIPGCARLSALIGMVEQSGGSLAMSDDAWRMECIVRELIEPHRLLVKINYLPLHNSTHERVKAFARVSGDKAPVSSVGFRGSDVYRAELDRIHRRQERRFFRMLDDVHEVIALRVKSAV